jgi:hypothetical protein
VAFAPNPSLLAQLASAYMQRERQRVGIPDQERAEREAETVDLMRRAQAARIAQQMNLAPAEHESEVALRGAQTDAATAQAEAARALADQRETPKAGTPHYATDENGNMTAIVPQPDGTFKQVPVGNVGKPHRPPAPSIAILPTPDGYVRADRRGEGPATPLLGPDGKPLQPPPTTAMRNAEAGVTAPQMARKEAQQRAAPVLADLGSRALALNKGLEGGFVDRVSGMASSAAGRMGMNPAADLYRTGVRGFTSLLARSVGHVGVLTELDVQRTEELFPRIGDGEVVAREKLNRIQRIIGGQEPLPFQWEHPEYNEQGITQPAAPPAGGSGFRVIGVKP